jgi:hypothetical protein
VQTKMRKSFLCRDSTIGNCESMMVNLTEFDKGGRPIKRYIPMCIKLEHRQDLYTCSKKSKSIIGSDLKGFQSEFGHCYVPHAYSADPTLGHWWGSDALR